MYKHRTKIEPSFNRAMENLASLSISLPSLKKKISGDAPKISLKFNLIFKIDNLIINKFIENLEEALDPLIL